MNLDTELSSGISSLCEIYKKEESKSNLEKRIFDFFNARCESRQNYDVLVKLLRDNNVLDLMHKANNVYFSALIDKFLSDVNGKDEEQIFKEYILLSGTYACSDFSHLYAHYLKVSLFFSGIKIFYKEPDILNEIIEEQLILAGWVYKKNLYYSAIDNVVKFNNKKTKSSVVVISNQVEDGFLNSLAALRNQTIHSDCKVVFVSNNKDNQTKTVLSFVDTFIQLSDNYGDCLPRNIGALFSCSEVVIFMEDDGIPGEGFVDEHIKVHERADILSLRGCCLPITAGSVPNHYWLGIHEQKSPPILEGNSSFKLNAFYGSGGWGDYLFFGHGGYEICYRMIHSVSKPEQHIYSPRPILYHNWAKPDNMLESKQLRHHALWHLLRFRHHEFYKLPQFFES